MPERLGTGGGARGVGPGLHPHRDGAFDQACLGAVSGQQLGLALDDVRSSRPRSSTPAARGQSRGRDLNAAV
jgi:hypothetical protein